MGADVFEELPESDPDLQICCVHMGTDEVDRFLEFAHKYEHASLDTTFAMSTAAPETMGFDPSSISDETLVERSRSIIHGSDFPNNPYQYREERAGLLERNLALAEPSG